MRSMFGRKKIVDERITNAQNKIYREIYMLVMLVCVISIVTKFILNGYDTDLIQLESFILFGSGVYYLARSVQMGLFSDEVELHNQNSKIGFNKISIIVGAVVGLLIAVLMGINSAYNYADSTVQAIEYFFVVGLVCIMMYVPFLVLVLYVGSKTMKKASDNVNKKMLEEDLD